MKKFFRTVDKYLAGVSADKRAALQRLRKAVRAAAPKAEECIAYGVPAFRLGAKFLVAFGAGTSHCAFYPGSSAMGVHRSELRRYGVSKGTIRFQPDHPLPASLVKKLVRARIARIAGSK